MTTATTCISHRDSVIFYFLIKKIYIIAHLNGVCAFQTGRTTSASRAKKQPAARV